MSQIAREPRAFSYVSAIGPLIPRNRSPRRSPFFDLINLRGLVTFYRSPRDIRSLVSQIPNGFDGTTTTYTSRQEGVVLAVSVPSYRTALVLPAITHTRTVRPRRERHVRRKAPWNATDSRDHEETETETKERGLAMVGRPLSYRYGYKRGILRRVHV